MLRIVARSCGGLLLESLSPIKTTLISNSAAIEYSVIVDKDINTTRLAVSYLMYENVA
jgi:hypothetical protein